MRIGSFTDGFKKSDKMRILALLMLVSAVFILFRFTERYLGTMYQVIIGWGFFRRVQVCNLNPFDS